MRKLITAAVLAATASLAIVMPAHAGTAVDWKARTCAAADAYASHPSAATLAAMVTDSVHLGRSYLKADVGQLYADASSPSPKAARYVSDSAQYVYEDCHNGYGA